ncbi:MAG: hypothetical protein ACD_19C00328G0008 [uncultured bacterium]|nr:MAG: hypothetical protein ACD_19C00328G0008 [uncultured bacterium]
MYRFLITGRMQKRRFTYLIIKILILKIISYEKNYCFVRYSGKW